jgi:hypothetical protein
MKSRANKSKNYNVASIQESEKHESMMREKRWTKAQRESEKERDTDTKTGRERERESGVLFIAMHRNIFIGKNESVDERSGWDPSTLVERRTHSPPPPSLSLGARESSSVFGRRGDPGTLATQTNSAEEL